MPEELEGQNDLFYESFIALRGTAGYSSSGIPRKITFQEIFFFSELNGIVDRDYFSRIITYLDRIYIEKAIERLPRERHG